MTPTQGRIVLYVLSQADADLVNAARYHAGPVPPVAPPNAQMHIGNHAAKLDIYPMMVVRVWPDEFGPGVPGVNGQVFLDGNDVLWVTSVREGTEPGTWWKPAHVPEAKG
jgi:hypothetical protein